MLLFEHKSFDPHGAVMTRVDIKSFALLFPSKSLAVFLCLMPLITVSQAFAGADISLSGSIAFDKKSVSVTVKVTDVVESTDLKPGASQTEYKNNIQLFIGTSTTPIRISRSNVASEDFDNDFYWDAANASVNVVSTSSTELDITYKITVYENTDYTDGSELDSKISGNAITMKAAFLEYDATDGTYNEQVRTEAISIPINFSAPADFPTLDSVTSFNKDLRVSWTNPDTVIYGDSETRTPPEVIVTVYKIKDGVDEVDLSSSSFLVDASNGDDTLSDGCVLNTLAGNDTGCVLCTKAVEQSVYLKETKLKELVADGVLFQVKVFEPSPGKQESTVISGLVAGESYGAFVQYKRGSDRSNCKVATIRSNLTLTELNGEKDAKLTDQSCYIATAAFGSPLNDKVGMFRWFRNNYLLTNQIGKKLVQLYYRYSPPLAKAISESSALKSASVASLYPAYFMIAGLKTLGPIWSGMLFLSFMFGAISFLRGRKGRERFLT